MTDCTTLWDKLRQWDISPARMRVHHCSVALWRIRDDLLSHLNPVCTLKWLGHFMVAVRVIYRPRINKGQKHVCCLRRHQQPVSWALNPAQWTGAYQEIHVGSHDVCCVSGCAVINQPRTGDTILYSWPNMSSKCRSILLLHRKSTDAYI